MNNKYLFNGENWIVTSGEIKITQLHGTRPMHPALSKKLYDQNAMKYTRKNSISGYNTLYFNLTCRSPPHADISTSITTINKYTIVELTHNNKHYHGLASRADCDKENAVTGIAVAYHRAFEKMMAGFKIGVATYNKNNSKIHGSSPNKIIEDDDWLDHLTYGPVFRDGKNTPNHCWVGVAANLTPEEHKHLKQYGYCWDKTQHNLKSLKRLSEDKNIPELIHESINALKATGKEPTEIRIKPVAAEKLRREFEIKYEWFGGERFIEIEKYFGLKYIIDPSIDVDIIII